MLLFLVFWCIILHQILCLLYCNKVSVAKKRENGKMTLEQSSPENRNMQEQLLLKPLHSRLTKLLRNCTSLSVSYGVKMLESVCATSFDTRHEDEILEGILSLERAIFRTTPEVYFTLLKYLKSQRNYGFQI